MEEGLLSLKWNNHHTTLVHLLRVLREQSFYTDALLVCGSRFFGVHRLVLMACSDYFCDIFGQVEDCPKPVIVLNDIAGDELESLLDYMYLGEVDVHQNKLPSLIKAAECLHIKGLAANEDDPTKPLKSLTQKKISHGQKHQTASRPYTVHSSSSQRLYNNGSSSYDRGSDNKTRHDYSGNHQPKKRRRSSDTADVSNNANSNDSKSSSSNLNAISRIENSRVQKESSSSTNLYSGSLENNNRRDRGGEEVAGLEGAAPQHRTPIKSEGDSSVSLVKVEESPGGAVDGGGGGGADMLHTSLDDTGQHFQQYLHTSIDENLFSDVNQGGAGSGVSDLSGATAHQAACQRPAASAAAQVAAGGGPAAAAGGGNWSSSSSVRYANMAVSSAPAGKHSTAETPSAAVASHVDAGKYYHDGVHHLSAAEAGGLHGTDGHQQHGGHQHQQHIQQQQQQQHLVHSYLPSYHDGGEQPLPYDLHHPQQQQRGVSAASHVLPVDCSVTDGASEDAVENLCLGEGEDEDGNNTDSGGGGGGNRGGSSSEVLIIYSVHDLPKPHSVRNTSFSCGHCEKMFYHRGNFVCHLGTHTGEKPFGCTFCSFRTSRKGNLESHIRSRHLSVDMVELSPAVSHIDL